MAEPVDCENVGLQTIADATTRFANNFLKVITNNNRENLITSPLCAQMVLAMAAYGAGGKTAAQMRSSLFIPSNNELGQCGYQCLIESLNAVKSAELRLASKIYTAAQFEVKSAFKELTSKTFLTSSEEVDFNNCSSAANTINTWCEEQTNKRITNVINPGSLDPCTLLMLVTAVYFKGQWENKFNPSFIEDRPFYIDEDTIKDLPTMFIRNTFRCGDIPNINARFIEIPYQGRELSMIIILPDEVNGLRMVQENLHQANLNQILEATTPRNIQLYLPKFKIETTLDLNQALKKLGMTEMYGSQANFSGIANVPLAISRVVQKAFIEVNEEGTEAAAITRGKILLKCCKPRDIFNADRPFYYEIRSASHNVLLFAGLYLGNQ